jgi:hypothetical protein
MKAWLRRMWRKFLGMEVGHTSERSESALLVNRRILEDAYNEEVNLKREALRRWGYSESDIAMRLDKNPLTPEEEERAALRCLYLRDKKVSS